MKLYAEKMAAAIFNEYPQLKINWGYDYELIYKSFYMLYKKTGDEKYFKYIKDNMDRCLDDKGNIICYENMLNIDHLNLGKSLILLFNETQDNKYKKAVDILRAQLDVQPKTECGGFWHKKIYPYQMWLDGLYMGSAFWAEYANAFGEDEAYEKIAEQFKIMYDKALDEKTGLLYHAWDESRQQKWADKETGHSPNFWGRAMGWYIMALVDVLCILPDKYKAELTQILRNISEALLRVRDEKTGLWFQVLDRVGEQDNYPEASSSCMITAAFAKAARNGLLDKRHFEIAADTFNNINKNLVTTSENGFLTLNNVCEVAGLGGEPYRDGSYEYYVHERIKPNDFKGSGPYMLASIYLNM